MKFRLGERPHRAWIARVPDPTLHRFLSRGRNWVASVAAIAMISVCWPILGTTTFIPGYLLPAFALLGCGGIAVIFFGEAAVRAGWALTVVTSAVAAVVPNDGPWPMPIPLFLALLVMTVAALCTQPLGRLPVVAIATAGAFVVGVELGALIGWLFALVVVSISIAFVRYRASSRRVIAEQTEETEVLRAREAVLAERTRIARDLHDIVAHRMSMIVVMAQTAPYRLAAADPVEEVGPGARTEFDGIADAARASLDEVRQLLGVLRPHHGEPAALAPVQGLGEVAGLIDGVRGAGISVDVHDDLDHQAVAPTVGAVIYRIVQESLTNATRHSPGSAIVIRLTHAADRRTVDLEVGNGPAAEPSEDGPGGGHGIIGMTERAAAVGGTLTAAPRPDGGFEVRAELPAGLG